MKKKIQILKIPHYFTSCLKDGSLCRTEEWMKNGSMEQMRVGKMG